MTTAFSLSNEDGRNDAERDGYSNFVDTVTRAINEVDPMGLLAIECPLDEYSPEVGTIVPLVVKASSADEVKTILFEEFDRWFGSCSVPRATAFDRPSQAIWQAVLDFRSAV